MGPIAEFKWCMPRKFDKSEWQMIRHGAGEQIIYCEVLGLAVEDATSSPEGERVFIAGILSEAGGLEQIVSVLRVDPGNNEVRLVYTIPEYRRSGIASELLQVARQTTGSPLNRDDGGRSEDGVEWMATQGVEPRAFSRPNANLFKGEADETAKALIGFITGASIFGNVQFARLK